MQPFCRTPTLASASLCLAVNLLHSTTSRAQENYEIQVYGAELVPVGKTMVEIHSNFTVQGQREILNGVQPSIHAWHETLEVTHGFTPWFETGFYVFSSIQPDRGWQWVGDHLRPRLAIPAEWHWPVGLSLSSEIGYQRRSFSEDTWTFELRPIIDKQVGPWYFAVNPAIEKSIRGLSSNQGWAFAPAAKVSYDLTKAVALGVEYYSSVGPIGGFSNWSDQQEQIFPTVDLNLSPEWEINVGLGFGLTRSTDGLIFKMILGYRF